MLVDGRVVVGLELFSKQLVEGIMAAVAKEGNGQTDHYDELCICEVPSLNLVDAWGASFLIEWSGCAHREAWRDAWPDAPATMLRFPAGLGNIVTRA
jgi:hypothetical protein